MVNPLNCFKTYDIRGELGSEMNPSIAYRIGRAVASSFNVDNLVVGFDARETSPVLATAVAEGICDEGANVLNIGLSGTEEMYWAVSSFKAEAGIEVTASHNPINYNGMKIVKFGAEPLSDAEFFNVKKLAEQNAFSLQKGSGKIFDKQSSARVAYIKKILSFVDYKKLKPLRIVINSGNGVAGPIVDAIEDALDGLGVQFQFIKKNHNPDSSFPSGIPNPLVKENRISTSVAVKEEGADFGVAFDGDFDRCFLFDHLGNFIPSEYVVGLLIKVFLNKSKGATIVHDPRVIWNTEDIVKNLGGYTAISKTGHSYVKRSMRKFDAVYGGEMSAHHYFQDFNYCDSGMIPWLIIWQLLSVEQISLYDLVEHRKNLFPSSGEINFKISNNRDCINNVKAFYSSSAVAICELDGLSMSFTNWRFNIRISNTEPLVRLNIETKEDFGLLQNKIEELSNLIKYM